MPDQSIKNKLKYDVFVSHSSLDKVQAYQVLLYLERQGLKCWLADRDNEDEAGESYQDFIIESIVASKIMVVLLSDHAKASKYVVIEVERAYHYDKIIIPFQISELTMNRKLEFYFSTIQILDATKGRISDHFEKLWKNCNKALAKVNLELESEQPGKPVDDMITVVKSTPDSKSQTAVRSPDTEPVEKVEKPVSAGPKNSEKQMNGKKEPSQAGTGIHAAVITPAPDTDDPFTKDSLKRAQQQIDLSVKKRWRIILVSTVLIVAALAGYLIITSKADQPTPKPKPQQKIVKHLPPAKIKPAFHIPVSKYDDTTQYDPVGTSDSVSMNGQLFSAKIVAEITKKYGQKVPAKLTTGNQYEKYTMDFIFYTQDTVNTVIHKTFTIYKDNGGYGGDFFKLQKKPFDNAGNLYLSLADAAGNYNIYYVHFNGKHVAISYITVLGGNFIEGVFSKDEKTLISTVFCQYQYEQYPTKSSCVLEKFTLQGNRYIEHMYGKTTAEYSLKGSLKDVLYHIQRKEPAMLPNTDLSEMNFTLPESFSVAGYSEQK